MQEIIIIAGPNGAGKTSFASEYLSSFRERFVFLNADEIAQEIGRAPASQPQLNIRAGREMLTRITAFTEAGSNLLFETTLATLSYARKIATWQQVGCSVALVYLRLPNVEMSIARVRRRVAAGGHDIPEDIIRKRFPRSLEYYERIYKPLVNEWYTWDSLEGSFEPVDKWDD